MGRPLKFQLHDKARLFDPETPGLTELIECLKKGTTIRASQQGRMAGDNTGNDEQWLECETSGSTGKPKIIRRRPETWTASFEITKSLFAVSPEDHYGIPGAPGHSISLFATLEAFHIGAGLSILSGLSPARQALAMKERAVTVIYATPTQVKQLCRVAERESMGTIGSLRLLLVGGGKLHREERARLSRLFPAANIVEFYGTSETSFITLADGNAPEGSVGHLYPGVELDVAVTDNAAPHGEIRVRSPYLASEYADPDSGQLLQPDGFVSTGEIGCQDAEGYLHIMGRADRMISVSDVKVFPEAIEQALATLGMVQASAVIGIPDDLRGSRIVCFVVPTNEGFCAASLRRHCRERLGEHHIPKEVRCLDHLPMLPSGKPDLERLRLMAMAPA